MNRPRCSWFDPRRRAPVAIVLTIWSGGVIRRSGMRKLGLRSCHVRFMADFRQARRAWGFADSLATLARITAVSGILLATAARAEDTLTLGRGDTPALGERRNAGEGTAAPTRLTREDLGSVLPLFLKSPESRQLAADLVSLLRQGDHATARKLLENFIDASIFASLATDWLDDPTLLSTLDAQGIKSTGSRPKAGDPATAAQVSDLQKALEQERERGQALAREKAAAVQELASLQAAQPRKDATASQVSELQKALERERERGQALAREKAAASEKLASLQAGQQREGTAATQVRELQKALEQERERGQALAREKAAASEKLASLQAGQQREGTAATQVRELQKALEQERERGQALAREKAAAVQELASVQASQSRKDATAAQVSDLQKALEQERERGQALAREKAAASEKLASLQAGQQR